MDSINIAYSCDTPGADVPVWYIQCSTGEVFLSEGNFSASFCVFQRCIFSPVGFSISAILMPIFQ
jgi:hypothetical protein